MPKNRDRRVPTLLGLGEHLNPNKPRSILNPNKPRSIVLCSVYMLGVDPNKVQALGSDSEYGRQYQKMLDDTRGAIERALSTLNTEKRLKKTALDVRGPKFFGFPQMKTRHDVKESEALKDQMRRMCKTVIHVKQDTGLRVYGLNVMCFHPDLGIDNLEGESELFGIVDPYDPETKARAEESNEEIIYFGYDDPEDSAAGSAAGPNPERSIRAFDMYIGREYYRDSK